MNCDRKPILQSQQSDIFAEKHNSAQIFCQIFPALPDSDGHVCRLLFFSAASCLPLSISVIWGGAGWLVGGWDNYRNQISDERRVCLSHDPPFSLFPSCLFYLLSSSVALSQDWAAPASRQICFSLKYSVWGFGACYSNIAAIFRQEEEIVEAKQILASAN